MVASHKTRGLEFGNDRCFNCAESNYLGVKESHTRDVSVTESKSCSVAANSYALNLIYKLAVAVDSNICYAVIGVGVINVSGVALCHNVDYVIGVLNKNSVAQGKNSRVGSYSVRGSYIVIGSNPEISRCGNFLDSCGVLISVVKSIDNNAIYFGNEIFSAAIAGISTRKSCIGKCDSRGRASPVVRMNVLKGAYKLAALNARRIVRKLCSLFNLVIARQESRISATRNNRSIGLTECNYFCVIKSYTRDVGVTEGKHSRIALKGYALVLYTCAVAEHFNVCHVLARIAHAHNVFIGANRGYSRIVFNENDSAYGKNICVSRYRFGVSHVILGGYPEVALCGKPRNSSGIRVGVIKVIHYNTIDFRNSLLAAVAGVRAGKCCIIRRNSLFIGEHVAVGVLCGGNHLGNDKVAYSISACARVADSESGERLISQVKLIGL